MDAREVTALAKLMRRQHDEMMQLYRRQSEELDKFPYRREALWDLPLKLLVKAIDGLLLRLQPFVMRLGRVFKRP